MKVTFLTKDINPHILNMRGHKIEFYLSEERHSIKKEIDVPDSFGFDNADYWNNKNIVVFYGADEGEIKEKIKNFKEFCENEVSKLKKILNELKETIKRGV